MVQLRVPVASRVGTSRQSKPLRRQSPPVSQPARQWRSRHAGRSLASRTPRSAQRPGTHALPVSVSTNLSFGNRANTPPRIM